MVDGQMIGVGGWGKEEEEKDKETDTRKKRYSVVKDRNLEWNMASLVLKYGSMDCIAYRKAIYFNIFNEIDYINANYC